MESTKNIYSLYINNGIVSRRTNFIFEKLVALFFRKVDFDEESLATLKEYSEKGRVVYISFQSSNISLLILNNILKRHKFNIPVLSLGFSSYLLLMIFNLFKLVKNLFSRIFSKKDYDTVSDYDYIKNLIEKNKSIALSLLSRKLFVRRYLEIKADSIQYLVEAQRKIDTPIYIFPQIMFWNRNPERTKTLVTSKATSNRGLFSAMFTTLKSATAAFMRIATPINLQEEIDNSSSNDSKQIARSIRDKLLEKYSHEKRTILGPVIKSQQEMMEKVLYHENILDTIKNLIQEQQLSEKKLRKKAFKYFKEIAADFSIIYIRFFEKTLDYIFNKIFDGVHFDIEDFKKLREASLNGPLIIMPSHKSHMDYLIISALFYQNKLIPPHILAGSNLTFFPMGKIFRRSGAFFMRRSFRGLKLYSIVLKQYIKTLINEGYSIEFFIEGGRTRTGKLVFPKKGIMNYLIEAIDEGYNNDMIFVPVTINYDRILEEKSHQQELKGREKKGESTSSFVNSRKLLKRKYGKVYLSFSEPISFQELRKSFDKTENLTADIGTHIIKKINNVIMVTPFALVSAAMLFLQKKGFSKETLTSKVLQLLDYLKFTGAFLSDALKSESNIGEIIDYVIEAYDQDNIISEPDLGGGSDNTDSLMGFYILNTDERGRICFYKNSIVHYCLPVSFISLTLLSFSEGDSITEKEIKEGFENFMNIFSKEFVYSEFMDDVDHLLNITLEYLEKVSVVTRERNSVTVVNGGFEKLKFYAIMIQDFLESYFIVIDTVANIKKERVSRKDLVYEIRKNGIKMYNNEDVKLTESLSMSNYDNGLNMLSSVKVLNEDKTDRRNIVVDILDFQKAEMINESIKQFLSLTNQ